ncbi:MAG TPA: PfkB family carbohydrate kinase, partial [Vicinamibacterales bacterium]|nr:PfkB family carbohydrate kinase [Vicinamibacterales bacterium]
MTRVGQLVSRLDGRPIVVVGDVMLDHFVVGAVDRISPEAPVPVVRFSREEYRLGGAANVASNLRTLGASVEMIALLGIDSEAERLRAELGRLGIGTSGLVADPERCTTRKTRVVTTRNQQVARIDYENDAEASGAAEQTVLSHIERLAAGASAILLSDYLKGAVSSRAAAGAIAAARKHRIPLTVDPKVPHVGYYRGATLVTPNHHEAEAITHMRLRTDAEAAAAARRFREVAGCENVLITRGEHGMWLHTPTTDRVLRAEAREVADVTGAGDTVIATMTLAMAAGAP